MKKSLIGVILLASLALTSCGFPVRYTTVRGAGNVVSESRQASGFDRVELSGVGTLIIEQGDRESLEITAEENLLPYLQSRVSGNTLNLGVEPFVSVQPTKDIIYRLTVVDLSAIETSGLGDVEMSKLDTHRLSIEISGSGKVMIGELTAERLDMEISGLGDIQIAGQVGEQRVELSGAGSYQAEDLQSGSADVRISGSGNATIWVTDDLNVEISGMGRVEYFGSPTIDSDISGAGNLVSAGEK